MTIRDLLVHVDHKDGGARVVETAMELADKFSANLTGLYVVPPANIPVYAGIEAAVSTAAMAQLASWIENQTEEAKVSFNNLTGGWQNTASWLEIEGESVSVISSACRNYDLVIVRQALQNEEEKERETAGKIALDSGRPVLVLPAEGTHADIGKRIMVAWNGKREAARAVHDALPFLKQAEAVNLLSINPPLSEDIPCAEIATHLSRHGVNVETEKAHVPRSEIGHCLVNQATTYGADLIVMGAYGHSRVREIVLGGTTHDVLKSMRIPVLMSH